MCFSWLLYQQKEWKWWSAWRVGANSADEWVIPQTAGRVIDLPNHPAHGKERKRLREKKQECRMQPLAPKKKQTLSGLWMFHLWPNHLLESKIIYLTFCWINRSPASFQSRVNKLNSCRHELCTHIGFLFFIYCLFLFQNIPVFQYRYTFVVLSGFSFGSIVISLWTLVD